MGHRAADGRQRGFIVECDLLAAADNSEALPDLFQIHASRFLAQFRVNFPQNVSARCLISCLDHTLQRPMMGAVAAGVEDGADGVVKRFFVLGLLADLRSAAIQKISPPQ